MFHFIGRLFLCTLLIMGLALSGPAFGQDAEPETTPPEISTQEALQTGPVAKPVATPEIDLSDPALREALEAREKADRAIAEAVKAQQEKAESVTPVETAEMPAKKSLIPSNAEDAKALGQKILDKVIGWLTSISFLAQLGAIILAYFLSPIIARMLKKRIFLFRDEPGAETKLKIIRDYIYRSREFLRAVMLVGLLALFALILKNIPAAGQDWLVKLAQGLAVVFLLYKAIKTFLPNPLFQKLAIWIVIPLAVLAVFGYYDNLMSFLKTTVRRRRRR